MKFAWIHTEKAHYPVTKLCRWLGVTPGGYHAWRQRPEAAHTQRDRKLKVLIRASFDAHKSRYGSPRIYEELQDAQEPVSKKRVARLMREEGLKARPRKRFKNTTMSDHDQPAADNVLDRQFTAEAPNQRWVGDTTEFVIGESSKLYLAVILDLFSRFVVGWALSAVNDRHLTIRALDMALKRRSPGVGLLHHSDQGCTYASEDYQTILEARGITCSMSRRGVPPQLYTFVQGIADVLDEYNRQAGNVDISASPGRVAELQALNRRRLTRLRLLQPPTAKAREAADLLIAGFGETERRFEYYTSPAIPSRSPAVDLNLLRNEVQYSADGFAALVTELAPYKDSAPELFAWAQESFDGSSRLLEKLSSAVSQQSTSPPSIVGTWSDVGGTFTNRIVRTPEIRIADRRAGGFVIVPEIRGLVEGFNFLLTGNASIQNGRIAADLIIGFYLKLSDGNEACNRKATLELELSGKDLLVGTARFSALDNTGVRSQTFGAVCTGLPSGTKQVKLQRVR